MSHYVGSYGDGYNANATDPYATNGAGALYGCGGCNATGAGTPSTDCPAPTTGYGGGPNHRGLFDYLGQSPPVTIATIRDGLSNTIALGHMASVVRSPSAIWVTSTGTINGTSLPINWTLQRCMANPTYAYANSWTGRGFSSFHPGGVNVGMADGSVRFIKQSINQRTYNALGSRNGGEITSSDSY